MSLGLHFYPGGIQGLSGLGCASKREGYREGLKGKSSPLSFHFILSQLSLPRYPFTSTTYLASRRSLEIHSDLKVSVTL